MTSGPNPGEGTVTLNSAPDACMTGDSARNPSVWLDQCGSVGGEDWTFPVYPDADPGLR
jgi:hypothetical protein